MLNAILSVALLCLAVIILLAGMIGCALLTWALIQMGKDDNDD